MKKLLLVGLLLTALFPTSLHAQTQKQKALVRTRVSADMKGGDPIPGAEVKLKGGNRYTSDTNGMFSFPVRGSFEIESAHKEGYVMIDPKYLKHFTTYSENAIPVIMEDRRKLNQEINRHVTRLNKDLADANERLMNRNDSLRKANAISQAKYDSLEQVRSADYRRNSNWEIIQELASYYANMDFQVMQEMDRKFYAAMSEGDYNLALNLIKSGKSIEQLDKKIAEGRIKIKKEEDKLDSAKHGIAILEQEAADICYRWVEYYKAQFIFDSAAYYYEKRYRYDTTNLEWLLESIEYIYQVVGDYERAFEYTRIGMVLVEENEDVTRHDVAIWYNALGAMYVGQGDYDKAIFYFEKTLKTEKKDSVERHDFVALIYKNIGACYFYQGNCSKALEYCNMALNQYERAEEKDSLGFASIYSGLGSIYAAIDIRKEYAEKDINKAMSYLNKALGIAERALGLNTSEVAHIYNNIGSISKSYGDYGMELYYFSKAKVIREQILYRDHPDVAMSYSNMGVAYIENGDYKTALVYLNKALEIQKKVLRENHPEIALTYNNIGCAYQGLGDYTTALTYYTKSLSIYEKVFEKDNSHVVDPCKNIGYAYLMKGDFEKSIEYYSRSLAINEHINGKENSSVFVHYYYIGSAHFALGHCAIALDYISQAVSYFEKAGEKNITSEISLDAARKDIALIKEKMKNGECQ